MTRTTPRFRRPALVATLAVFAGGIAVVGPKLVAGTDAPGAAAVATEEREPSISGDGRKVVYVAPSAVPADPATGDGSVLDSVWFLDRSTGRRTELTTPIEGARPGRSVHPVVSEDGCTVVVVTELALDLFRDDDHGARWDIYRTVLPGCAGAFEPGDWELVSATDSTEPRASDTVDPSDRPALDATGALVAFTHAAPADASGSAPPWSLISVADLSIPLGDLGRVVPVPGVPEGGPAVAGSVVGQREPALSSDGRFLAFTSDIIPSVTTAADGSASISGAWTGLTLDGRAVTQVVRWDRVPSDDDDGVLFRVVSAATDGSIGDAPSSSPALDETGQIVAFASVATNLRPPIAAGDAAPAAASNSAGSNSGDPASTTPALPDLPAGVSQVYRARLDTTPATTGLVSAVAGVPGDGPSTAPALDAAGDLVAFETLATNLLAPGPTATSVVGGGDLLVADIAHGAFRRVTVEPTGLPQAFGARSPQVSSSGRTVVYETVAAVLPPGVELVGPAPVAGEPTAAPTDPSPGSAWRVAVADSPVALSTSDLDLGTASIGNTTATWFTTIVNHGQGSFVPQTISTTDSAFAVTGGTCRPSVALAPGESCTVELSFTPVADGPVSADLVVAERGYGAARIATQLTATGGEPTVASFPSSLDFGPVRAEQSTTDSQVVSFTNTSAVEAAVAGVVVAGTEPADFPVLDDRCTGRVVAPGEACQVAVGFSPTDSGPRSATISVHTTGGATAAAVLVGSGFYAPAVGVVQTTVTSGGRVDVVGLGFPANTYVALGWDGDQANELTLTDDRGELHHRMSVPRSLGAGRRSVVAVDPVTRYDSVQAAPVVITATPNPGASSPAHRHP